MLINNIYCSRKIGESLRQNIHFMWRSGMSKPDYNTINRFRGERLQQVFQLIFYAKRNALSSHRSCITGFSA
ncbi:transposase [Chitinophaga silvatica]|uniref:Transposase n=1 Tax=Chitinophaga silvatica TaxID=2282649 RepID=A0A3E1Y702_9BACT|nr:transposase [Chitinophaga silvatica]